MDFRGAATSGVLGFLFLATPGFAAAADTGSTPGHPEDRTLGGYRFIPSSVVPDPFITSYFRNVTGAGMFMNAELPLFQISPDSVISLKGDLLLAELGFGYSFAPDDIVSFRISGGGATRVGTGGEAILAQGVTAASAISAGTTIRMYRSNRVQIAAGMDLGPFSNIRVDIADFVRDLIDSGLDVAELTRNDTGVAMQGGVRIAYAFNEWSGVHGVVDGVYTNSVYQDDGGVIVGGAVSADLGQRGSLPIGFMFTARYNSLNANNRDGENDLQAGFGVFYTGRDSFSLGLESQYVRLPVSQPHTTLDGVSIGLTTRFFF